MPSACALRDWGNTRVLDPLGRAGGVLPSADPSALEVAMDRNKQEDELAKGIQAIKAQEKAAAADNKQKEREAADKRKTALADGTLWFAHTLEGQKAYSNLVNSRAKRYQDYEAGIGADPDMEGTDAYIADQIELQAWNQMNANSEQLRGDHAKVKQYIMENRDLYTDDALEKTDEEYANPEYLKNGELPNTLVALIDLNKAIENQFGAIEAEVAAWANPASDGGIFPVVWSYTLGSKFPVFKSLLGVGISFSPVSVVPMNGIGSPAPMVFILGAGPFTF